MEPEEVAAGILQAHIRGFLVRRRLLRVHQEYLEVVREIEGKEVVLYPGKWHLSIPQFTTLDGVQVTRPHKSEYNDYSHSKLSRSAGQFPHRETPFKEQGTPGSLQVKKTETSMPCVGKEKDVQTPEKQRYLAETFVCLPKADEQKRKDDFIETLGPEKDIIFIQRTKAERKGHFVDTLSPRRDSYITQTDAPVREASHLETDAPVREASHLETDAPVREASHLETDAPVREASHLETDAPVREASHLETDAPVREASLPETDAPVREASLPETDAPVREASNRDEKKLEDSVILNNWLAKEVLSRTSNPDREDTLPNSDIVVSALQSLESRRDSTLWCEENVNIELSMKTASELRKHRSHLAMEILWVQQAIASRKNYLMVRQRLGACE